MRTGATRLLTYLILAYFVGLIYAGLNAGRYAGLEAYGLLFLAAVEFGILAIRDKPRLGTAFLVLYNASWIFATGAAIALLLDLFKIVSLPIPSYGGVPDTALLWMPFGLFFLLHFFHIFRFKRVRRFLFFAWTETTGGFSGTEGDTNR